MTPALELPSFDPSRYQWAPHPNTPGAYRRRALAGENLWIQRSTEVRQLFLSGSLSLSSLAGLDLLCIHAAAKKAWWQVRCENPTIAASWHCDDDGNCWLDCSAPNSAATRGWVDRTVVVSNSHESPCNFSMIQGWIDEIKEERRIKDPGLLCLYAIENKPDSRLSRFRIMLNFDHIVTDGIGIRILAGKFLAHFARAIAYGDDHNHSGDKIKPGSEYPDNIKKPPSPWTDLLNGDQLLGGKSYKDAVQRQCDFLLQDCTKNQYSIPLLLSESIEIVKGQQRACFRAFSVAESKVLLQRVKIELGPLATITHLGHAAMILTMLRGQIDDITSPGFNTSYFSPCWMNGRPYLCQDKSVSSYTPVCQALGEVVLSDCEEYIMQMRQPTFKRRDTLIQAAKVVSQSYQALRRKKSILSESVPLMEWLGQEMFRNRNGIHKQEKSTRAAPFFLSDGITEQYILQEYHSASGDTLDPVFAVDDLRFTANAEGPNLIVRMSSWKDTITLSAELRSEQYTDKFVKEFLEEMAILMLSIND